MLPAAPELPGAAFALSPGNYRKKPDGKLKKSTVKIDETTESFLDVLK
jgi:hypothetical protein